MKQKYRMPSYYDSNNKNRGPEPFMKCKYLFCSCVLFFTFSRKGQNAGKKHYKACQQNPQQATTHYQQALAADARYSAAYIPYLGALLGAGVSDSTLMQTLKDAVDYFPEQPIFRSLLVRLLATSSDPQLNDPREALRLAEQLAKEKRIPPHLEVLALANAANGRFKQAAAILEEVLIQIVWSMPGEAARLGEVQVAYQAGKLPPTEERQGWPVIPPPVFDAQGPFHNYPVTKPY